MTGKTLAISIVSVLGLAALLIGGVLFVRGAAESDPVAVSEPTGQVPGDSVTDSSAQILPGTTISSSQTTAATETSQDVGTTAVETTTVDDTTTTDEPRQVLYLDEWANREGVDFHEGARQQGFGLVQSLADDLNFEVTRMQNADELLLLDLSGSEPLFDVVVMWNSDGEVFDTDAKKQAFQQLIGQGTNFVGVHSASATHWEDGTKWAFYNDLVGGIFDSHPPQGTPQHRQTATVIVEDGSHPSTSHLGATFQWSDEWYNFEAEPQNSRVLLSVDETSYLSQDFSQNPVTSPNNKHSVAWTKDIHGVKSFYTMLGHFGQDYAEPAFIEHIDGALGWALE